MSNMWIISEGKQKTINVDEVFNGADPDSVNMYMISYLADYLLCPRQVELKKKLIGCEVHYKQPAITNIRKKIRRVLPNGIKDIVMDKEVPPNVWTERDKDNIFMSDKDLEAHFEKIDNSLRPFDTVLNKLYNLDISKVAYIMGYCEEPAGGVSSLNLNGSIEEKRMYLIKNMHKKVGVIHQRAYQSSGVFDLRGYNCESYQPKDFNVLLKFMQNGQPKACVIGKNKKVNYFIDDLSLISSLQLFDKAIKTNHLFKDSIHKCIMGKADAYKLHISSECALDYTELPMPKVYQNFFMDIDLGLGGNERDMVVDSLKESQVGIIFDYVLKGENNLRRIATILHNVNAIEPLKHQFSQIYTEISKKATQTEVGSYYFLDGMEVGTK